MFSADLLHKRSHVVLVSPLERLRGTRPRPPPQRVNRWPQLIYATFPTLRHIRAVSPIIFSGNEDIDQETHTPMDVLAHIPEFRVVVCKLCKTAVHPSTLSTHLRRSHLRLFSASVSRDQIQIYVRSTLPSLSEHSFLDPRNESIITSTPDQTPIPQLRISSGYGCSYCPLVSLIRSGACKSVTMSRTLRNGAAAVA